MNQRGAILPIVALVIVILLGVGWYVTSRQDSTPGEEGAVQEQPSANDASTVSGTFEDLFALGRDVMCTFSGDGNTGTFYIDTGSQRMRGDFTTTTDSGSVDGHIINDSEYVYTWTDGEPQGVQLAVPEGNPALSSTAPDNVPPAYQELNQDYEYDCDTWSVDESKFTLPSGIDFLNVGEQFQQMQAEIPAGVDCSVCEQATGPAKEQCLQALNCI